MCLDWGCEQMKVKDKKLRERGDAVSFSSLTYHVLPGPTTKSDARSSRSSPTLSSNAQQAPFISEASCGSRPRSTADRSITQTDLSNWFSDILGYWSITTIDNTQALIFTI
jgi:hypothetical protein